MRIIPAPSELIEKEGAFIFRTVCGITADEPVKSNLKSFFMKVLGVDLLDGKTIIFKKEYGDESSEGYTLDINESRILVTSSGDRGLFYGAQTLKQIFFEYYDKKTTEAKIPCVTIKDEPRFKYRGFMFDCARHYFPLEIVKRYIDAISMLKLNKFHWHLTEDQGWRIEISKYHRLTEVGSRRRETMGDKIPHGGFYTKEQVTELVKYASERYITVIPEFDMPGHTRAVVASYPELSCEGKEIEVSTKFGIHPEILCGGNDKSYEFVKDILSEFSEMFPGEYIHIGGDEAIKNNWYKCEKCQKKIKELGLQNEEELQAYMTDIAINHLKSLNKTAICWNEASNSGKLNSSAILQYWSDGKNCPNVIREVKAGRKIIVSRFTPMYLDYPYAMHSLRAIYDFEPVFPEIEKYEENVLGVESPIWTEYIGTSTKLSTYVFPRLTALSEMGWSKRENKDYDSFLRVLDSMSDMIEYETGIMKTPSKKCNPKALAKPFVMIKFGSQMLDFEMITRAYRANREMKKMRKTKENV